MKTWLRDIERATTGAEVLASARDFVSLWSPRELPEGCREIRIEDEADIPRLRERLASSAGECSAPRQNPGRLHELVAYLSRATERLGELRQP